MKKNYENKAYEAITNIKKFDRVHTYPVCNGKYIYHRLTKEFANGAEVIFIVSYEVATGKVEIEKVLHLSAYCPAEKTGKHGRNVYSSYHGYFEELSFTS